MLGIWEFLKSSVARKYIVSLTGFVLVGFVLTHLLGNLQIFWGKEVINKYAYFLHHLPPSILWGFRVSLIACAVIHVVFAVWLTVENILARPETYKIVKPIQASLASLTMPTTGILLFLFVAFHLLNFTFRIVPQEYNLTLPTTTVTIDESSRVTFDVYRMMVDSFSVPWITASYIVAMGLLGLHLGHGVSSMFQSLGLRNERWRLILNTFATWYGWLIFLGYISIPLAVILGVLK